MVTKGASQRDDSIASGLVFSRRELFTLLGSAAFLVACGSKSHTTPPITVSTGTTAEWCTERRNRHHLGAAAGKRRRHSTPAHRRPAAW